MTKANYVLAALLVVAVGGCVMLTYFWIDRSISLSYARQSVEIASRSTENLRIILENDLHGRSEVQVFQLLEKAARQQSNTKPIVKINGDVIWFDEERFNFKDGRLISIGKQSLK
jgi:hypothetical protein